MPASSLLIAVTDSCARSIRSRAMQAPIYSSNGLVVHDRSVRAHLATVAHPLPSDAAAAATEVGLPSELRRLYRAKKGAPAAEDELVAATAVAVALEWSMKPADWPTAESDPVCE